MNKVWVKGHRRGRRGCQLNERWQGWGNVEPGPPPGPPAGIPFSMKEEQEGDLDKENWTQTATWSCHFTVNIIIYPYWDQSGVKHYVINAHCIRADFKTSAFSTATMPSGTIGTMCATRTSTTLCFNPTRHGLFVCVTSCFSVSQWVLTHTGVYASLKLNTVFCLSNKQPKLPALKGSYGRWRHFVSETNKQNATLLLKRVRDAESKGEAHISGGPEGSSNWPREFKNPA